MSEETIIEVEATEVPEEEPTGDETAPEEPKAAATALKYAAFVSAMPEPCVPPPCA